jgi:hypothetical protein
MHRGESPFIRAISTSQIDADGSDIQLKMIPRSFWDEDPRFLETYGGTIREQLRQLYDHEFSNSTKHFVYLLRRTYPNGNPGVSLVISSSFDDNFIRGPKIAEALTMAIKVEDLADAFTWFERSYPSDEAQVMLQDIRNRALSVQGNTTSQGSVPDPSRALNNEVAYMIFDCLGLEFDVCLTGLRSATHLNGRQGIIRGPDPGSHERWKVRLDDGTCVSVKAINLVHIRRANYRRISP